MEIRRGDIIIRDICPSDIADHVRWRTVDTEWMNWDAPWRQPTLPPAEAERFLRRLAASPLPAVRTRFEIALDTGEHIGWMNSYPLDGVPEMDKARIPELRAAVMRGMRAARQG